MIKNWKLFTETWSEPEYLLKIETQFSGSDKYINLSDFTDYDYDRYKANKLNYKEELEYTEIAIEEFGISWEIDGDELVITTIFIGVEERIDLDNPYDPEEEPEEYDNVDYYDIYTDSDLEEMAIDNIGISWEIIPNKEHPNYQKNMKRKKFNL